MEPADGRISLVLATLLPGADVDRLANTLLNRKTTVKNAWGNLPNYLAWVYETADALRGQVTAADIDRLLFTRRWELLLDKFGAHPSVIQPLLRMEIDERAEAFEAAHAALTDQISHWNARPGVLTVVDTSVFIAHEKKIAEIDYATELGLRDEPIRLFCRSS
jgi:hypothetical protein